MRNFKVNGAAIAEPTKYKIKKGAAQKGRRDIKAQGNFKHVRKMRTVLLTYDFIKETDLLAVLVATWDKLDDTKTDMTFQFTYTDVGGDVTYTAYISDMEYEKSKQFRNTNIWENLSVEFILY